MSIQLSNDFETDTAGLTLSASGSGAVSRTLSAAVSGGYGLETSADMGEVALATAEAPATIAAGGSYVAGLFLRASDTDADALVMQNDCFRLWLTSGGGMRLDVFQGRVGSSIALESIAEAGVFVLPRRAGRVVVEIVRDTADGASDGEARLWIDGEAIGELTGLDLYETAVSIQTTIGTDRSFADDHFLFEAKYASASQVATLGLDGDHATVYRRAAGFDGSGDVVQLNHVPTTSAIVTMVLIPTLQAAVSYFYGNASFGFGVNVAGNAILTYRGATAVGPAVVDGVEQTWEMGVSGESAALIIDGELAVDTAGSATMVSDPAYLGAQNLAGTATNFAAMELLHLTASISASGEYDYTFHRGDVDPAPGAEVIYNQGTLGASGDISNVTTPGVIVGTDLEADAVSTCDVGLASGSLSKASTILRNSDGSPVAPLANNQSATYFCELQVPSGSLSEPAQVIWGYCLGAPNFNYTCGIYGTATTLRFYVATGAGVNQKVYECSLPTTWAKVALVMDKDDPLAANHRMKVFIDGSKVEDEASAIGDTWPGFVSGPTGSSHLYGVNKHDPNLQVRQGRIYQRALSDSQAIALTGGGE